MLKGLCLFLVQEQKVILYTVKSISDEQLMFSCLKHENIWFQNVHTQFRCILCF
jgi:hypothetical protein